MGLTDLLPGLPDSVRQPVGGLGDDGHHVWLHVQLHGCTLPVLYLLPKISRESAHRATQQRWAGPFECHAKQVVQE